MLELLDILCRRIYPLLQTVVGELIQDNEIVLSDESLDHPIACHPASGVDQDVSIPVLLELLLQLLVQSKYNEQNLFAPMVEGVPAELNPNYFAALMAASFAKGC